MSHRATQQECDQAICDLFPDFSRPIRTMLAALVFGVVTSRSGVLRRASAAVPGEQQDTSKFRRAQRLLVNPNLDLGRAQRRLLARVLSHHPDRLDLLLDATTTGATKSQGGTMSLILAVAWQHRAVPVLWKTWETTKKGQHWEQAISAMLDVLEGTLPPGIEVTILTDRGLTGVPLVTHIRDHGWHYLVRAKANAHIRLPDGSCMELGALVPRQDSRRIEQGVRIWPSRPTSHKAGKQVQWEAATLTNVTAVWRHGDDEPWLVISDLPAGWERCREYRHRTWEEALFRDLKSMGWQWNRCRVHQPSRVERWLLILALATLWMLALGQRVVRRGQRHLVDDRSRRHLSLFRIGIAWVDRLRANDQHVPCILTLWRSGYAT